VFALAAAMIVRPDGWWGGRARRLAGPFVLAVLVGTLAMAPFLLPYYWASEYQGFHRTAGEVAMYSASWRDYLSTGARVHFDLWSARFWTGTALFPDVVATGLALTAISPVAWRPARACGSPSAWPAICRSGRRFRTTCCAGFRCCRDPGPGWFDS
jgi:hypothetical protein